MYLTLAKNHIRNTYFYVPKSCVRSLSHRGDTMLLISVEIKTKFQLLSMTILSSKNNFCPFALEKNYCCSSTS